MTPKSIDNSISDDVILFLNAYSSDKFSSHMMEATIYQVWAIKVLCDTPRPCM